MKINGTKTILLKVNYNAINTVKNTEHVKMRQHVSGIYSMEAAGYVYDNKN